MRNPEPALLASPDQVTRALAVACCAAKYALINEAEHVALEERLVDGAPLATLREVVDALLLLAPRGSVLEHRAQEFLEGTSPPRDDGPLHGLGEARAPGIEVLTW